LNGEPPWVADMGIDKSSARARLPYRAWVSTALVEALNWLDREIRVRGDDTELGFGGATAPTK